MDPISRIQEQLVTAAKTCFEVELQAESFAPERPPNPELGDLAIPCFPLAKLCRRAPQQIAAALAEELTGKPGLLHVQATGPYLNISLDLASGWKDLLPGILEGSEGNALDLRLPEGGRKRIALEFSCPNTNKPQHLGHARNNILGDGLARLLSSVGHDVIRINLINDRGIHICRSMLAYQKWGEGVTPQSTGEKGDHLVGRYYVLFATKLKEEQQKWADAQGVELPLDDEQQKQFDAESALIQESRLMLEQWEAGDPGVLDLWETMNGWVFAGFDMTYQRMGIDFDKVYLESQIWKLGKAEVLKGLEQGILEKHESGAIVCNLDDLKLKPKVLLRSNGTSLYMVQDIGNAVTRHEELDFEEMIYVVGSEQEHHFRLLFHILQKLGYDWASNLLHFSYGMVNLTTGKMKSREGKVVDADDLLAELEKSCRRVMDESERRIDMSAEERDRVIHDLALGALRYYVLKVNPTQDMIYDPEESLDLAGNTGPYLQYARARMGSLVRKSGLKPAEVDTYDLLVEPEERELLQHLLFWKRDLQLAAEQKNPARVAHRSYELARSFSRLFNAHSIFDRVEDKRLAAQRIALTAAVAKTLGQGLELMGMAAPERI